MPNFERIDNLELNPNEKGADIDAGEKNEDEVAPEELEKPKIDLLPYNFRW